MNIPIAVVIVNRRILVWHLAELSGVVALIAELFHTHRNQRVVRQAMGQVPVNAVTGDQVGATLHLPGHPTFQAQTQLPQATSRCSVTCPVSGLLRAQLFRFAIEAANFHLFQCTAYMFRHAVPGPSAFRARLR
jgi:hypothetical protein